MKKLFFGISAYHDLKKKNNDYRRYVSLLEQQQKLLTLRLGKLSQRNLNCEQKTSIDIIQAYDKRNDIVEEIRQLRQKNFNFEKLMAQDQSKNKSLQYQIQTQNDTMEKLLQINEELSLENKKLRKILRMEEEASKLAEKVENRRLDQLSLVDPVYADYLRRRWALEGNRNLYDWEVAKFVNLFPPFLDPKLRLSEESRNLRDRVTLVEPSPQNSENFLTNRGKENSEESIGFDNTKNSRVNSMSKLSTTSTMFNDQLF